MYRYIVVYCDSKYGEPDSDQVYPFFTMQQVRDFLALADRLEDDEEFHIFKLTEVE